MAKPFGLIITPTHELAIEVHHNPIDLCWYEKLRCCAVYGETPLECQLKELDASPGRLLAFLKRGVVHPKTGSALRQDPYQALSLANLQFIVYDEADELMSVKSKGDSLSRKSKQKTFEKEIDEIERYAATSHCDVNRFFFSSQYSPEQAERARQFMNLSRGGYANIDFDMPDEDESQRYTLVEQNSVECSKNVDRKVQTTEQKIKYLQANFFDIPSRGKLLILVRKRKTADQIEYYFMQIMKVSCEKSHGDLRQSHREQATYSFKHGFVDVLIATTKLGDRGVNYDGVTEIVFWDLPDTLQEYMYCLGRFGRVGNKVRSTAFYSDRDYSGVVNEELLTFLEKYKQTVLANMAAALTLSKGNGGWDDAADYKVDWDDASENGGEGSDAVGDDAGGDDAGGDYTGEDDAGGEWGNSG